METSHQPMIVIISKCGANHRCHTRIHTYTHTHIHTRTQRVVTYEPGSRTEVFTTQEAVSKTVPVTKFRTVQEQVGLMWCVC